MTAVPISIRVVFAPTAASSGKGDASWRKIAVKGGLTYGWDRKSTYVQNPPYFVHMHRAATPDRKSVV